MSVLSPGSKPTNEGVLKVINLIDDKSCNMHDFAIGQKTDIDKFCSELSEHGKDWMQPPKGVPNVKLYPAWKKIETFINDKYKRLPRDEREVFRQWLQMQLGIASSLYQHLEEVDRDMLAKRPQRRTIAGQDKMAVKKITEHPPEQAV